MTGIEIQKRRRRAGLTQAQLAKLIDVHFVTLSRYETGDQKIPLAVQIALDKVLRALMLRYYKLRNNAHAKIADEVRVGRMTKATGKCADCSAPATEYDHRDYFKPLRVQAVCRSCNALRGPAIATIKKLLADKAA